MRVLGPPVCHRRNDSVFSFKVRTALFGMHDGRMVKHQTRRAPNSKLMMRCFWCLSTGNGAMCAINRSSKFILLSIQIHLCDMTRMLYVNITAKLSSNGKKAQMLMFRVLSTGIPCLLLTISYRGLSVHSYRLSQVVLPFHKLTKYIRMHTVETGNEFNVYDDEKADNYDLNLARHAFSCSMRSVRLLQNSCMRSMPWLHKGSVTYLLLSCC